MADLIPVSDMPILPDLDVPGDVYFVHMEGNAWLAGMKNPEGRFTQERWTALHDLGLRSVICLMKDKPNYTCEPLEPVYSIELQNLLGGRDPRNPAVEERKVRHAVASTIDVLGQGKGVIVHCQGGRGRTGTVVGCVLRRLGHSYEEIRAYLDVLHKRRDRPGWPESEWQADLVKEFE